MSDGAIMILMSLSLFTAGSAIGLRAAQERNPDPNDISAQKGLGHMLVGILAWSGVTCAFLAGLYLLGVMRTVIVTIPLIFFVAFTHFGDRVHAFYRFQTPLALVGLLLAILLWLILISQVQGDPNV